jgi:dUTP pyrophosphatase
MVERRYINHIDDYSNLSTSRNTTVSSFTMSSTNKQTSTLLNQKMSPLLVKKLVEHATIPHRATSMAAGYDISAAEDAKVPSQGRMAVPTGISIGLPEGTYGRIAPRSGLAYKFGIDVLAGVIDQDYRGEVKVILYNSGVHPFNIQKGDRIAQLIIEKIETPDVAVVMDIDETERGDGGFGSTGV